ncbi:ATP-binding cassette domain-containing protein [Fluviibacterium sp. DFM31]|uniref:ATP-binding cassette domain-containing protein n=1 Tax=Meridianimarinicoccus marinus TaxID=3231483 RepID=A0ABV3LC80_9RHOB
MTRHSRDMALAAPDAGRPVLDLSLPGLSLNGTGILGPVTLSVAMGETLAITGPSGIGKSTLLNLVAGQITAPDQRLTTRGSIGMVYQSPTLLPWRSACHNLTLTTGLSRTAAAKALAEVGLAGKDRHYPGQMSLGQQRRLSLARAFARAPQLLLLDEPFVSLDPDLADGMMALFARMRAARGSAAILVTHSPVEIDRLASRVLRLDGKPATLRPA